MSVYFMTIIFAIFVAILEIKTTRDGRWIARS